MSQNLAVKYNLFWIDTTSYRYPIHDFCGSKDECIQFMIDFSKNSILQDSDYFDEQKCNEYYTSKWRVYSRENDENALIAEFDSDTDKGFENPETGWVVYLLP